MNNNRSLTQGTSALRTAASNIRNQAEQFLDRYTAFFKEVEGDLSTNWVGSGSREFIDKVTEMRPKYHEMYLLMNKYAAFIEGTASSYEDQADAIASGAKGLSFE